MTCILGKVYICNSINILLKNLLKILTFFKSFDTIFLIFFLTILIFPILIEKNVKTFFRNFSSFIPLQN